MKNYFALFLALMLISNVAQSQMAYAAIDDHRFYDMFPPLQEELDETDGIETLEESIDIQIQGYVAEDLYFQVSTQAVEWIEVKLYNQNGQQVKNIHPMDATGNLPLDFETNVSKLNAGNYLLVASSPNLSVARTITKL